MPVGDHSLGSAKEAKQLLDDGRCQEAAAMVRGLLAQASDDADAWAILAAAHFACEEWQEAERAAREVVRLRPDNARDWCNLGTVRRKQDKTEEAVGAQRRALSLDPGNRRARAELRKARQDRAASDMPFAPEPGPSKARITSDRKPGRANSTRILVVAGVTAIMAAAVVVWAVVYGVHRAVPPSQDEILATERPSSAGRPAHGSATTPASTAPSPRTPTPATPRTQTAPATAQQLPPAPAVQAPPPAAQEQVERIHRHGRDLAIAAALVSVKRRLARPESARFSGVSANVTRTGQDNAVEYRVTGQVTFPLGLSTTDAYGRPATAWRTVGWESVVRITADWQGGWYVPVAAICPYTMLPGSSLMDCGPYPGENAQVLRAIQATWRANPSGR